MLLPISGLFDANKEIERLEKQKTKIMKDMEGLEKQLGNDKFLAKAPENVISEAKAKKMEFEAQLKNIELKKAEILQI